MTGVIDGGHAVVCITQGLGLGLVVVTVTGLDEGYTSVRVGELGGWWWWCLYDWGH